MGRKLVHTIDVGLGALTGRPFALTGARVPAFSAALCSRWTYGWMVSWMSLDFQGCTEETAHTLAFLEIGMALDCGVFTEQRRRYWKVFCGDLPKLNSYFSAHPCLVRGR